MLRALGSASCDITHETGGTTCCGHWVLRLVISHTRDRCRDLLRALGSASCNIKHGTGCTICYGHWVLRLVISHTRQEVRFVTGIGFCGRSASCDITHETGGTSFFGALGSESCDSTEETRGTTCCGLWVLRLVILHTRQGVRFVTGIGICVL